MDFGEIIGDILFYLLSLLAIVYIFYLIVKFAVKNTIISLLPNLKSALRKDIIEAIKKCENDKK